MSTIFTKIINGEIPSHKIYEDDKAFAFLDIFPTSPGHTLIVPKIEVDKIYDLPDDYYDAMFAVAKKLAKNMDQKLGKRIFYKVIGTDVPHAHIHLYAEDDNLLKGKDRENQEVNHEKLAEMAKKLRLN